MVRILAALVIACASLPALAAGEVGTVGDTAVIVPWGSYLVAFVEPLKEVLVTILVGVVMALVARLGPMAAMLISEALVESTVRKFIDYGYAVTEGAVKGKALNFEVGSQLVANTVNRAQDRAAVSSVSRWAVDKAGGPRELANKVIRMIPVEEGVRGDKMAAKGLVEAMDNRPLGNNS